MLMKTGIEGKARIPKSSLPLRRSLALAYATSRPSFTGYSVDSILIAFAEISDVGKGGINDEGTGTIEGGNLKSL